MKATMPNSTNMLEVALVAVRRLPGFKKNKKSWCSYTNYMFEHSPGVRKEILDHDNWWPRLTKDLKG
jgi:hypothetical protein